MARVFLSPNYNNPNGLDPGMARDESLALDTIEKIEGGWPSTDLRAVYIILKESKWTTVYPQSPSGD